MGEIQVTIHTECDSEGPTVEYVEFPDHGSKDYSLIKAIETYLLARKEMLDIERAAEEAEYRNELLMDPQEWL